MKKLNEFLQYNNNGELELTTSDLPEIIDFHLHLGLTAPFPFMKCDINNENAGKIRYLGTSNPKTLDIERFYHNNFPKFPSINFITYSISYLFKMYKYFPTCTIPNLLDYMKSYNIKKAVIQIIDFPKLNQCEHIIKSALKYEDIITFCFVDPKDQDCEAKLKKYKEMGAKGLKFHPIVSNVTASDDRAMKLFDACDKLNLPVLAHSGQGPVKKGFKPDPSRTEFFEPVFKTFPNLKFVLAHIGSTQYKKAINYAEKYENVFLETSETPAFVIKEAIDRMNGDKIFYGTDYSFNHPAVPLAILLEATKDNEHYREKILYNNADTFLTDC